MCASSALGRGQQDASDRSRMQLRELIAVLPTVLLSDHASPCCMELQAIRSFQGATCPVHSCNCVHHGFASSQAKVQYLTCLSCSIPVPLLVKLLLMTEVTYAPAMPLLGVNKMPLTDLARNSVIASGNVSTTVLLSDHASPCCLGLQAV